MGHQQDRLGLHLAGRGGYVVGRSLRHRDFPPGVDVDLRQLPRPGPRGSGFLEVDLSPGVPWCHRVRGRLLSCPLDDPRFPT